MGTSNRWEWRVFARKPAFGRMLANIEKGDAVATSEQYLLSLASSDNVKVRNGALEIKHLIATSPLGLEQWCPVLKREFPLDSEALRALWAAWGLPSPVASRPLCTLDQLLHEVVDAEPALTAVTVEKQRTRIRVEDCRGEHVLLLIRGEQWESIALENVEPERVISAIRWLGLENATNTSYPAALKRIIGFGPVEETIQEEER